MYKRVLTHIVTLLCIVVFLAPRLVNLHAFSHISDDDSALSCELCDLITDSHQFDGINCDNPDFEIALQSIPTSFIVYTTYDSPQERIASPTSIYNKPPPFL